MRTATIITPRRTWYVMGEGARLSKREARLADDLCNALEHGTEVITVSTINAACVPDTTVLVAKRPGETLVFVRRQDGSVVLATDHRDYRGQS